MKGVTECGSTFFRTVNSQIILATLQILPIYQSEGGCIIVSMNNNEPEETRGFPRDNGPQDDFWTSSDSAANDDVNRDNQGYSVQRPGTNPSGGAESQPPAQSGSSPYKGWAPSQQQVNQQSANQQRTAGPMPAATSPRPESPWAGAAAGAGAGSTSQFSATGPSAQQQTSSPAGATTVGPAGTPVPAYSPQPAKEKKKVGLGTALAMMLVGSVAAGSITGVAVSGMRDNNTADTSTSVVNDVLNKEPATNSNPPAEGSIESVAAKVLPAVVSIQVATRSSQAEGSGSIISPDGYVLTNHHVIEGAENGGRIQVTMNDGTKHDAEVVASDVNTDVGVVKIKDASDLPFMEFGDSNGLHVGQEVVAIGSPLGLNATVTSGIVSAMNRPVRASQGGGESSLIDAIQTDAAVNPGNSGGPLVDLNGNLVGMNSMIASLSQGGGEAGSIGLGFAIPSNFAKRMADQLINKGSVTHPMLGVQVDARDSGDGARIVSVEPGSPAERAGLKDGDVVTKMGDRLIENSDSLIAATRSLQFGETTTLEVRSEGENDPRSVEVTLSNE